MRLPAGLDVVTPPGRSLLMVAVVCYLVDTFGGWPVFQLLWVAVLVMLLAAVVFAVLPVRGRVEIEVTPRRTIAGDRARVSLVCQAGGVLPVPAPVVDVPVGTEQHLLRLPTLRRGRTVEESLTVATPRRGVIRVGPIQARRTDPLTLLRWSERWSTSSELLVLPRMVPLEPLGGGVIRDQEGTPSDEISMNDLAFHALREYVPGDELRHVHWRSSAKADKLLIRQYHDTRRSHFTFVIDDDPDAYPAPEDFETAVSAAASMAARADGDGVDVSLLCGDHAVTGRGLDSVLDTCCRIELAAQAPPLPPVRGAREALQLAPETSWLVVLTGSAGSAGLAGALRAVLPPDITVLGVACDSGSRTSVSEVGGVRLVLLRGLDDLPRVLQVAAPAAQT